MHIREIVSQHRRDFRAIYECEHCGYTYNGSGYDDDNFHKYVIPGFVCSKCGKTADDTYVPRTTKYPANVIV